MNITFETERLILRPFTIADLDDVYQMNLDPQVSKYTGDGGVQSREVIKERLTSNTLADYKKYGYGRMAVIDKSNNQFIGFSGLKYLDDLKEVDIGYRFISSYWGKGIATEATRPFIPYGFNELRLDKIIGLVLPGNIASARVLEKLGFGLEKYIVEDGERVAWYNLGK